MDQNWVNCWAKFGPKESNWTGVPIEVEVLLSFLRNYKKILQQNSVLAGPLALFLGLTQIKRQVSRRPEEIRHFYCGENRVKILLLFLTLETLDFESEHFLRVMGNSRALLT